MKGGGWPILSTRVGITTTEGAPSLGGWPIPSDLCVRDSHPFAKGAKGWGNRSCSGGRRCETTGYPGPAHPFTGSQNEVAPPFPRSWWEGGLWLGARHQVVLPCARSIAIRSSPLHGEQSCSISNPLASPPVAGRSSLPIFASGIPTLSQKARKDGATAVVAVAAEAKPLVIRDGPSFHSFSK